MIEVKEKSKLVKILDVVSGCVILCGILFLSIYSFIISFKLQGQVDKLKREVESNDTYIGNVDSDLDDLIDDLEEYLEPLEKRIDELENKPIEDDEDDYENYEICKGTIKAISEDTAIFEMPAPNTTQQVFRVLIDIGGYENIEVGDIVYLVWFSNEEILIIEVE